MPDPGHPNEAFGPLACRLCGELLTQVNASEHDEIGPRRIEYKCSNGHRLAVQLEEAYDDDDNTDDGDPAV
jgi:hypothetical protein